ncbi:hypothetical protein [Citrobacter koseri]|uniref:hypothetical protein n=1 Tax=Citrobacter koseri TaxID=545 RepID=UPI0029432D9F|nr:hypothetical protein [Citrobacter koseri]MEB2704933.1 hypothetical protein [Citrobacter koseri]MEB2708963.1 hypothetical protein [Citrobacter koseri]MEB2771980.1 hypothetical protein [Citrobacter koseri]WOJ27044.1 hypothetical protein R1221_04075 [Citrobacter koseri]
MAEEKSQSPSLSLTLQVMNGNELESGRAAKCLFSGDGGEIGHAEECHWSVQDRVGSVAGRACAIVLYDGAFCLRSLMPGLMINLAPVSTDTGLVRLRQGDEISLGALALKVFLHEGKRISYDEQISAACRRARCWFSVVWTISPGCRLRSPIPGRKAIFRSR